MNKIKNIEILRFLFCIIIVILHLFDVIYYDFSRADFIINIFKIKLFSAHLGVEFFFILAGFFLLFSIAKNNGGGGHLSKRS